MSSMRNVVQRRNHRERAQPIERERWGILEKHKDYSLRAKDYNEKKKRLKILRQKASERNPDEFHFAMMSSRTDSKGLKVVDRGNKSLSVDTVKLLKTQDAGYLSTMVQKTRKARGKLEQQVILGKGGKENIVKLANDAYNLSNPKHIIYVGSTEEQKSFNSDRKSSYTRTAKEDFEVDVDEEANPVAKRSAPTSKKAIEAQAELLKAQLKLRKQRRKYQDTYKSQLDALKKRERDLMAAEHELELQRAKMSGSVGGVTKAGIKWKVRQRKR